MSMTDRRVDGEAMNTPDTKAMAAECSTEGNDVRLLDGTVVRARCLTNDDVDAVLQLHQQLTDSERYLRFFGIHPAHLDVFARKLVVCDGDQCAVGAFEAGHLIGVANFVVNTDQVSAEIAVATAHDAHLRGVATALLHRLGESAKSRGIQWFTAEVLADNTPMMKVLAEAGWRYTRRFDGPACSYTIDLADYVDPYTRGATNAR
jgi:RimJ/RimL family protein N-acetyltransferase